MKLFSLSILLIASELTIHSDGNLIEEPVLSQYFEGNRTPGIMGIPEEVIDVESNPFSL